MTQVLKASDDSRNSLSAGETTVMLAVRRESVIAVGLAWAIRDYRGWLVTGLWTGGYALLIVATQLWAVAKDDVVAWSLIVSIVEAVVLSGGSIYSFRGYRTRRKAAREAVENVVGPGPMVGQDGSPKSATEDR